MASGDRLRQAPSQGIGRAPRRSWDKGNSVLRGAMSVGSAGWLGRRGT